MHLEDLHGLFIHELKDIYSAENQILDALPSVIERATDRRLRRALEAHFEETRNQVGTLEEIFRGLGEDPVGQTCMGMQGLLRESGRLLQNEADEDVLDAGIIAAVQRLEHYEIAAYGTVATYAKILGRDEALTLLLEILDEEKQADQDLTEIAKTRVNVRALHLV
jgi:ferritin-like metal-binding protein YciE